MTTPANWYPDPQNPTLQRYWDGSAWTEHTAPAAGPATGPAAPAATSGAGLAGAPGAAASAMPSYLRSSTLFADEYCEVATTGRMTRQNKAVVKVTLGEPLMVTPLTSTSTSPPRELR